MRNFAAMASRFRQVSKKTLEDLEFSRILDIVSGYCRTLPGKELAKGLSPYRSEKALRAALDQTAEYLSSFENENRIPAHQFDPIDDALELLPISNSILEVDAFRRLQSLTATVRTHQRFFEKFQEYYPQLLQLLSRVTHQQDIEDQISAIIDKHGEIRNDASDTLATLRKQLARARSELQKSFNSALSRYLQADFLDDIRESLVENRRVLAVKAMHRRKVKGNVLGTSKTGSIVYIEPETTMRLLQEVQHLELEETEEIRRILRQLGETLRPYTEELAAYQEVMTEVDVCAAKAGYARVINGILPEINENKRLFLRDAYHPLLLESNRKSGKKTWPQTVELHAENRIIVISGPNAGGKSITLKTIGLLQLMLQAGILIPVHERSSCCLFGQVLTDIGDNQSIENHLSTYSYRLKNMNRFLRKCDAETLFLIDEFGTGSDPELGGALAETFLENFYEQEAYGVITTHYANLKALADELPHATNANMLFDSRTLEPTFQLELGQPGSSFTFEVAQKNGIPYSLINKAKKKVSRGKVRFDASIAKLQKERTNLGRTEDRLQEEETKAKAEAERLEVLNEKIQAKLSSYQELYDYNQRMIHLGTKVDKAAESYFQSKKKRPLISELLRIVETENSKRKKQSAKTQQAERKKKEQASKAAEQEVAKIRRKKKVEKTREAKKEKPKPRPILKVGDRVRLQDSKSVGSIDKIEKGRALVNYGIFTTEASLDQLELVEAGK
ncbi:DNA mismatch repair protein MutS2 [Robiginitalea myxolifaciens]|uniref:DNA mismatch repair protein MutS2 n=1 Tax=Robiginitalea myxolifaciens TaxID=400055 RepID=A0A1I6GYY8_9FLAO|nr:DNA mismatch repair protein MutS [Robiginitalea myxolifaciens]SFR47415.1 DNA mismatch repair protein MutS2 [Robiginitalea myxolifaciens]